MEVKPILELKYTKTHQNWNGNISLHKQIRDQILHSSQLIIS